MLLLRRHTAARIALALALAASLVPAPITATAAVTAARTAAPVGVTISQPTPSVAPDGTMRVTVTLSLPAPTDYVEVRLRLKRSTGNLIHQKTEVRQALPAGEHQIAFEYDLAPLEIKQGRYPIDVRVLATDATPVNASSRLLVVSPSAERVPVAVVVTARSTPALASDGRFSADPATHTSLRDGLAAVARLALERDARLGLAVPPLLLDEVERVAAGYETTAGVAVPATAGAPRAATALLGDLRSAVAAGALKLVDVPYGLPDAVTLEAAGAGADLELHWEQSDAVRMTALGTKVAPRIAYLGHTLSRTALATLEDRGISTVLAPPSALRSDDATPAPGAYAIAGGSLNAIVVDEIEAGSSADDFYDALFAHLGTGAPAVALIELDPGAADPASDVQRALDRIAAAGWLRLTDVEQLARLGAPEASVTVARSPASTAPEGYLTAIAESRVPVRGYVGAVGTGDAGALGAIQSLLIAESSLWQDPDGTWPAAEVAAEHARAAASYARGQFDMILLDTKDVTLSSTKGDVPLTLVNSAGKQLQLTLRAKSSAGSVVSAVQPITIKPGQNLLTIPVDLGNVLSDSLTVQIMAGDVLVTETQVVVRASYVDRMGTILIVVLVLIGLLLYIRRKVRAADAATITSDDDVADGSKGSER